MALTIANVKVDTILINKDNPLNIHIRPKIDNGSLL